MDLDNVIAYERSFEEHLKNLEGVLVKRHVA